jgi:hypothetical protein
MSVSLRPRLSALALGLLALTVPVAGTAADPGGQSSEAAVAVRLDFDPGSVTVRGVKLDVQYDPTRVSLPGSRADSSVGERVQGIARDVAGKPIEGIVAANDHPAEGGKVDDTLTLGYVAARDLVPGDVVRVRFEQTTSGAVQGSDFACVVREAADDHGFGIGSGVTCKALVAGGPAAPTAR